MMPYRSEVLVYHNQSVCQVVELQLVMKSCRILDTLMLSYDFLSNYILYYVACMNSVHYQTGIACSEQVSHAYIVSLFLCYRIT